MQTVFQQSLCHYAWGALLAVATVCGLTPRIFAQDRDPPRLRAIAPGVMTVIEPELEPSETLHAHPLVEIRADQALDWKPEFLPPSRTLYNMAKEVQFEREVWGLEFAFKPLRMIEVDVPQASGRMQRKNIWYLVYRVRNTGAALKPVAEGPGVFAAQPAAPTPHRFVPEFVIEAHDVDRAGKKNLRAYLDRVMPIAMEPIRQREAGGRLLHNSVTISDQPIPVASGSEDEGVWGVAMWEDVDPNIDFFSVYVGGLTNAYDWADPAGAFKPGDPPGKGRRFTQKMLQLNFWRPGDEYQQHEREFRLGVAPGRADLYGVPEGVAYRWTFL